jgi:hypothetical protein
MSHPAPGRRALARELRARRQDLRRALRVRRQAARAALPPRRRRRWWRAVVLLLLLLLLLLLRDCSCSEPQAPPSSAAQAPVEPVVVEPPRDPAASVLPRGRIAHRVRPSFVSEPMDPVPWLAAYRLQVSARSPRLAECFVGAPRPGTLMWTASVEPSQGRISDQTLEPTLLSDALTRQQRGCVFDVLSDPPYQLESDGERSTPVRVGMAIEF